MELELLLVLSVIDRDFFRDEFYGLHWLFLPLRILFNHACMHGDGRAGYSPSTIHAFLYCPSIASFG